MSFEVSTPIHPGNRQSFEFFQAQPYISHSLSLRKFAEIKDARTLQRAKLLYAKALAEFSVCRRSSSFSQPQPAQRSFCSIANFVRGLIKTSNSAISYFIDNL